MIERLSVTLAVMLVVAGFAVTECHANSVSFLSWDPGTGAYSLQTNTPQGTLIVSGSFSEGPNGAVIDSAASLSGDPRTFTMIAEENGPFVDVELVFEFIGYMEYRLGPIAPEVGGQLLGSDIDNAGCEALGADPILAAVQDTILGYQSRVGGVAGRRSVGQCRELTCVLF